MALVVGQWLARSANDQEVLGSACLPAIFFNRTCHSYLFGVSTHEEKLALDLVMLPAFTVS